MPSKHRVTGLAATAAVMWGGLVGGSLMMAQAGANEFEVWDRVAQCESSGNWSINTGNGYYGGVQFSLSTWAAFGGREYAYYPHHASKAQQIAIARRTLYVQGPGAWPTCSVKAGLTKENGGADRYAQPIEDGGGSTPAPAPSDELTVNGDLDRPTIIAMQKWVGTNPDGIWGPATTRALQTKVGAVVTGYRDRQTTVRVQTVVGATPDGVWGPKTTSALQTFLLNGAPSSPAPAPAPAPDPAPAPGDDLVVNGTLDRPTIIAMQRWVGTNADGVWGPATTRALQAKVGASVDGVRGPGTTRAVQRTVGATADGIWGPATTRALQTYLNNLS